VVVQTEKLVKEDGRKVKKPVKLFAGARDLRRAFCSRWARKVMPAILRRLARHAHISTTMSFYVCLRADEMARGTCGPTTGRLSTSPKKVTFLVTLTQNKPAAEGRKSSVSCCAKRNSVQFARVAELADALDLGSSGVTRAGSSPVSRTYLSGKYLRKLLCSPCLSRFHFSVAFQWQSGACIGLAGNSCRSAIMRPQRQPGRKSPLEYGPLNFLLAIDLTGKCPLGFSGLFRPLHPYH
jgi:hypothetical protein